MGDSGMGGYFGAALKFAGYDLLVVQGRAEKPVYPAIQDDTVEIRDASALWGKDTYDTPDMIRKKLDDLTRGNDMVSEAYFHRPFPTVKDHQQIGVTKTELEQMKDDYYRLMELDLKTGTPTRPVLEKLDMKDVADRLGI